LQVEVSCSDIQRFAGMLGQYGVEDIRHPVLLVIYDIRNTHPSRLAHFQVGFLQMFI